MTADNLDARVRVAAFDWLRERTRFRPDGVLTRHELEAGFPFEGDRIPLVAPQGIFKPRILDLPLTITTAPDGPYADGEGPDGTILYRYRGTDPGHRDNAGVRRALERGTALIYFRGLVPGRYAAVFPVFVIRDDPAAFVFTLLADAEPAAGAAAGVAEGSIERRRYVTVAARRRLHQAAFRQRVLGAYRTHCAVCRLRHEALLDAAHIVPDGEEKGEPKVPNGLALCKIHHAAFDGNLLGVDPGCVVHVRADILEEEDGPMLQHGLKEMHGRKLVVLPARPTLRPDPGLLEERFARFRKATCSRSTAKLAPGARLVASRRRGQRLEERDEQVDLPTVEHWRHPARVVELRMGRKHGVGSCPRAMPSQADPLLRRGPRPAQRSGWRAVEPVPRGEEVQEFRAPRIDLSEFGDMALDCLPEHGGRSVAQPGTGAGDVDQAWIRVLVGARPTGCAGTVAVTSIREHQVPDPCQRHTFAACHAIAPRRGGRGRSNRHSRQGEAAVGEEGARMACDASGLSGE